MAIYDLFVSYSSKDRIRAGKLYTERPQTPRVAAHWTDARGVCPITLEALPRATAANRGNGAG